MFRTTHPIFQLQQIVHSFSFRCKCCITREAVFKPPVSELLKPFQNSFNMPQTGRSGWISSTPCIHCLVPRFQCNMHLTHIKAPVMGLKPFESQVLAVSWCQNTGASTRDEKDLKNKKNQNEKNRTKKTEQKKSHNPRVYLDKLILLM